MKNSRTFDQHHLGDAGSVFVGKMFKNTAKNGAIDGYTESFSICHISLMIFFMGDALTNLQLLRQTMKRHVLERPIPVVVVILRFFQILLIIYYILLRFVQIKVQVW